MSRSARLLDLVQILRRHRRPVSAARLAEELGVSLRTTYRDVATLQAQGAPIEGSAGLGYVLKAGYFLPPLMFDADEADALILGLRLVGERGDEDLTRAADNALAKIAAVLPSELEDVVVTGALMAGPGSAAAPHLSTLREAIRGERRLLLFYTDKKGRASERWVWPVAIGFFEAAEVLAAWCELRADFRHFRLDRIVAAEAAAERYPQRRRLLVTEWRLRENLD